MSFQLSQEHEQLRAEAREFGQELVLPGAAERDRSHEYPAELIRAAAERGYLGCLVPKEHGGSDLGNLGQCVALEEIAAACAGTHVTVSVHNSLCASAVTNFANDATQQEFLPKIATGESLGCYMLTEPSSGSDAAAMKTVGVRDGDDYVLNGDKMWITSGDVADVGVVFARTGDPEERDTRAISAFVMDMKTDGVTFGKREEKLGLCCSTTVAIYLKDVRIPASQMLGEENGGFKLAMALLNGGRIGIGVQAIGIARAAIDAALELITEFERAGRPLSKSQLATFRVADMAAELDAARLLAWRAASLRDAKQPHALEASMCKLFATRVSNDICRRAVALFGEAAYDDGLPFERLVRDCRVTELYEGTSEVQRLVIAKHLIGRR